MVDTTKVCQKYSSAEVGEAINKATCDSVAVALLEIEIIQGFYKCDQDKIAALQQFKPWKA